MPPIYRTLSSILLVFAGLRGTIEIKRAGAQTLTPKNYDQLVPSGKEVDAIYGDFGLMNSSAKAIIAFPASTRHSNMTVRGVSGCLIDFAVTEKESDQLSAFYPGSKKFPFSSAKSDEHSVTVHSKGTAVRPKCEVRYEFITGRPVIEMTSTWTNNTQKERTIVLQDNMRIDSGKERMIKTRNGVHQIFYVNDFFWQQAYALVAEGYKIRSTSGSRECLLVYESEDGQPIVLQPGESFSFSRKMIVGKNLPDVLALAESISGAPAPAPCRILLKDALENPIADADIFLRQGKELRGVVHTDRSGRVTLSLPEGKFGLTATAGGVNLLGPVASQIEVAGEKNEFEIVSPDYRPGSLRCTVVDGNGSSIPAKIEFKGRDETPTPNWGPESAEHFVRNLVYTENGQFEVPLQKGEYDLIVSHGPEYDAEFVRVKIEPGIRFELTAKLVHSVQTPGWVSSDFHSHSSPSGDNTGSQLGRVLNLAAENIEFAPCTEHNRVSTYSGHIAKLGLEPFLATVSGMELTGSPLPLNHQNVFPMKHAPRTQDGGGPVTDISPETQIERITLWDDRSDKLIQQNHPDIGWLFYDKNGDGITDEGYWHSFRLMDVIEIHPIDHILNLDRYAMNQGKPNANHRMLNWLQLVNQGFRIYGVVNTDAHYNYHGSGWLRNWIQSSTDDPSKIDPMEMVYASEQGRVIMSNGPYLEATFSDSSGKRSVVSGQDLVATDGMVSIHVRVQCPNWHDIDRVFLLINGRMANEYRFTRADNPDLFMDGVLKFDQEIEVQLEQDSHIVVVTGHQTEQLGPVFGGRGVQLPAALTNPVFVDVDGKGFVANKDTLGFPLPVKFDKSRDADPNSKNP